MDDPALDTFLGSSCPRDLPRAPKVVRDYRANAVWGPRIPVALGAVLSLGVAWGVGDDLASIVGGTIGLGLVLVLPFALFASRHRRRAEAHLRNGTAIALEVKSTEERLHNDEGEMVTLTAVRLVACAPASGQYHLLSREPVDLAPGKLLTAIEGPKGEALVALDGRLVTAHRERPAPEPPT